MIPIGLMTPEALAEVQRNWLLKWRTEKGLAQAVNLAGPFILSSQSKPCEVRGVLNSAPACA